MHTSLPAPLATGCSRRGSATRSLRQPHSSCSRRRHPQHLLAQQQEPHQQLQQHQQTTGRSRCEASSSSACNNSSNNGGDDEQPTDKLQEQLQQNGARGVWRRWQRDTQQMQQKLQSLGAAGVVAYGMFNTIYYTCAFLLVWFRFSDVGRGMGWAPVTQRAAEVFALVWAGSQVTKLLRAGAAVACAPLIERGLHAVGVTAANKRAAYLVIVGGCIALALAVLGLVVLLHA